MSNADIQERPVIANACDGLIDFVANGKVSIFTAEVIATLPMEEQERLVARGQRRVKAKASHLRSRNGPHPSETEANDLGEMMTRFALLTAMKEENNARAAVYRAAEKKRRAADPFDKPRSGWLWRPRNIQSSVQELFELVEQYPDFEPEEEGIRKLEAAATALQSIVSRFGGERPCNQRSQS